MTGCYAIYPFSTGSDQILVQVWSNANGWELSCFIQKCLTMIRKDILCVTTNCSCFIVKEKWLTYEMPCSAETSRCSYYFFFILQYICHRYYNCPCFLQSFDITTLTTLATWISSLGNITNSWTNYLSEYILAPHWMLTIRFLSD